MKNATFTAKRTWQLARPLRCLGIAALALWLLGAQAQNVQPPAVRGLAFQGQALQSLNTATHLECQAKCQAAAGCSGYTFVRDSKAASCRLFKGGLGDIRQPEAVSCRMPCTVPGAAAAGPTAPNATPPALLKATAPAPLPPQMSVHAVGKALPPVATPAQPPAPAPLPPVARSAANPARTTSTAAPTRSRITGWEVISGNLVTVPGLASAQATAQCPGNKIALSAGFVAEPNTNDSAYGLEMRGAWPEGNSTRVFLRNANAFVAATVRATAVCVDPIEGLHRSVIGPSSAHQQLSTCNDNERLVGGGAMSPVNFNLTSNGPNNWNVSNGGKWQWRAEGLPSSLLGDPVVQGFALCAPEAKVDGWEIRQAPATVLGARARTTVRVECTSGKKPLAAGFVSSSILDRTDNFISPTLQIENGWVNALVLNRNLIGQTDSLQTGLGAICALAQ